VKRREKTYVYHDLCQTRREGKRVIQETVAHLGTLSAQEAGELAQALARGGAEIGPWLRVGGPLLVEALFDGVALGDLMEALDTRHQFDLSHALLVALTAQLLSPGSQRAVHRFQQDLLPPPGTAEIEYHQLLRTLDVLAKHQRGIERALLDQTRRFYDHGAELDLLLYDLSSTCFEDDLTYLLRGGRVAKRLRRHAPSVLSLAITNNGFPIASDIHRGSLVDVEVLEMIVSSVKADFPIGRITVVADRGVFTEPQLEAVERLGYQYVLSLRDIPAARPHSLLDRAERQEACSLPDGVKVWPVQEARGGCYLLLHMPDRAEQTLGVLERKLEHARNRLQQLARDVDSRRVRRRATIAGHARRILRDAQATPFFAFEAQEGSFTFRESAGVLRQWRRCAGKSVWRAEVIEGNDQKLACSDLPLHAVFDTLPILTAKLGLSPMRHQNEQRLCGHVMASILAYFLHQSLRCALSAADLDLSADEAFRLCDQVRTAPVRLRERTLWSSPTLSTRVRQVLRAVGVENPVARVKGMLEALRSRPSPPRIIAAICSVNVHADGLVLRLCADIAA